MISYFMDIIYPSVVTLCGLTPIEQATSFSCSFIAVHMTINEAPKLTFWLS